MQTALNQLNHLIKRKKKLIVDGSLGRNPEKSNTVSAIIDFQRKVLKMTNPDGRIDVNGRSARKINELLKSSALPSGDSITFTLNRTTSANDTTLGTLSIKGYSKTWYILEPGGPDSTTEGSDKRIKAGEYTLKKYSSHKYPTAYELFSVPGRTKILIHSGNFYDDTHGCLLPGKSYSQASDGNYKTSSSKIARDEIFDIVARYKTAKIKIYN